jgi:hypothetical protein
MSDYAAINKFARSIARYVKTASDYDRWDKERVAIEAVTVMLTDEGAGTEAMGLMPVASLIAEAHAAGVAEGRKQERAESRLRERTGVIHSIR